MDPFWNYKLLNNSIRDIVVALGIILISVFALRIVQLFLIRRLKALAVRTKTTADDFLLQLLQRSVMPLLYILAIYAGFQYLLLSPAVHQVLHIAVLVVITFFFLRIITAFIRYGFQQAMSRREASVQREKQLNGILLIVQFVVWLIGFLFLIDNLGYDITTLVAGLGIGGIAIALAAQTILGDLFSYLVIFFDKPFEIGDFIVVGDKMGAVEYIGIKTTRLRSIGGEQLVCSNTDLTSSRLHNYKRMQERRVLFTFGVVYQTTAEQLKQIPLTVKEIIAQDARARFDRAHFKSFGQFSLDFEVVYYVLSPEYNTYMDIQQFINMKIFEAFEKEGIGFAYPTQTLYLNRKEPEAPETSGFTRSL